jgi:hypothetical protein
MWSHQLLAVMLANKKLKNIPRSCLRIIALVTFLVAVPQRGYAVDWVPISGHIQFDGTPLCALVLANGQHMFSCNGTGAYNLTVPLDAKGTITLYAFASGFSPFKQVLTAGEAAFYNVGVVRSDTDRELEITQTITPGSRANWVNISGTVQSGGLPVCAMALANGQQMFTCGNNLGRFSMSVPLDSKGEITLYHFASGFSPSKKTLSGGGNTGGGCTGGAYGCLTISGSSLVPSTFTPSTTSGGGLGASVGFLQIIWSDTALYPWSLVASISDNYGGVTGSDIHFAEALGVDYTCQSGFAGSYGDCSGATFDHNTRTVTFSNVKLQGPGFGTVITLNGTLKY